MGRGERRVTMTTRRGKSVRSVKNGGNNAGDNVLGRWQCRMRERVRRERNGGGERKKTCFYT